MPSSALLDGKKRRIMQVLHTQRPVLYPAGQYIQMEQEPLDRVLVVVEGLAKVRSFQHNGYEEVLNLLGPGDCMGLTCLFDACSAWGDVVALTVVQVLRVACGDLAAMLEQEPEMALCCMAMLHDQLLGVMRRVLERRLATNERLLLVLQEVAWKAAPMDGKDGARLVPPLSHAELAALAGLARETVSRSLGKLQAKGALIKNGKGWELAEPVRCG